jgi:hypothetical protein
MSTQPTLEQVIQTERELIDAIRSSSRRLTIPILLVLLKTFAIPLLAFVATWIIGGYFRAWMHNQFQDAGIDSSAQLAVAIATIAVTVVVGRWAEQRFGGFALIRRLMGISRAVLDVETALEAVRTKPAPTRDELAQIDTMAHDAWNTYAEAMKAYGFQVDA